MKDKAAIISMLDYLRDMDPKMWDQSRGYLAIGSRCWTLRTALPGCAGAHAAFGLGMKPRIKRCENETYKMWSHSQGGGGLADALGVPFHILCNSLERHGASHIPFGTPPWERYIYDVFRDTVKEITGYDHDAPVEPEDVVDQLLAEMQEEPDGQRLEAEFV